MYFMIVVINYIFNFVILWVLTQYFQFFWIEKITEEIAVYALVFTYLMFVIGSTPIGEYFVTWVMRFKKLKNDNMRNLFKEVCEQADLDYKKYRLMQYKSDCPNAMALGSKTIAFTDGLMEINDKEVIKGVVAHELGHIENNHTVVRVAVVFTGFVSAAVIRIVTLNYLLLDLWEMCMNDGEGWVQLIAMAIAPPIMLYNLLVHLQGIGYSFSGHVDEFIADRFAVQCGYREGLTKFLSVNWQEEKRRSILPGIFDSHPPLEMRLIALGEKTNSNFYNIAKARGLV